MTIATSTKEWISDIDIDIDADGQWPEYSVTIFFIYLPSRLIVILELTLLLTQPIDKQENLMKLHVGEYSTQAGKLWNHRHGDVLFGGIVSHLYIVLGLGLTLMTLATGNNYHCEL